MNIFLIIICFIKKMSVDKKIGSGGHEPIEGMDKKLVRGDTNQLRVWTKNWGHEPNVNVIKKTDQILGRFFLICFEIIIIVELLQP